MITSPTWSGKRYAVLGLARSGAATVDALLASGAEVVAWDASEEVRSFFFPSPLQGRGSGRGGFSAGAKAGEVQPPLPSPLTRLSLSPEGERAFRIADPLTLDLKDFDGVVVSPGIPLNRHPISGAARAAGVPVIGDIELFAQARESLPPHKLVGITGTNGKSTTTALVHHVLRTAGVPATMGGNIGLPILAQEPLPEDGVYVLELSSYQIDLTQSLDCDVAVLLNVTPDHLDRYDGFEAYRDSKIRLLEMQSFDHDAVVASKDDGLAAVVMGMTAGAELTLWFDGSYGTDFANEQRDWPALRGPHNAQNAWAARMTCLRLGLTLGQIAKGFRTFSGLLHRMERVGDRRGIAFVNDSKATNPASAASALAAFDAVHWILGGRAKSDDLDACRPHFGHVRAAYTIGEAGPIFARILRPHMPVSDCGTLSAAVHAAAAAAVPGEVVLLSPAAASFDQFLDFEARGDAFRVAVEALT